MERVTQVLALPFQKAFLDSEARYPAIVSGIGTGKTYMLLLKIWAFCETYPDTLALIVRKEYTDLRDSTIKDFERYFEVKVDSNKEHRFDNGSVIMFRHAAEIEVLKNINLSIFGIEQAEEFETNEQFTFLRDRLRRDNAPLRQGCIIANACGHNWIWKAWVNNPQPEFVLWTAKTFDNAENLPADFIADLKRMELEAPSHYAQFVENSFEVIEADDYLFTQQLVNASVNLIIDAHGTRKRILGVDVARFGGDEIVFTILESKDVMRWEQLHQEAHRGKSVPEVAGMCLDLERRFGVDVFVVDDDGVGGGVTDLLNENKRTTIPFKGGEKAGNPCYFNRRSEGFFKLKEMMEKGYLKILPDMTLGEQLMSIRYRFKGNGQKMCVPKDEMRKDGLKSPDRADALMMAAWGVDTAVDARVINSYFPREAVLTEGGF